MNASAAILDDGYNNYNGAFRVNQMSSNGNVVQNYFESVQTMEKTDEKTFAGVEGMERRSDGKKPRVIILGAGWGGYNFGK